MTDYSMIDFLKKQIKQHPALYSAILNYIYPIFITGTSYEIIDKMVPSEDLILNLGAGPSKLSNRHINIDFQALPNVQIIANVQHLPFKNNSVGGIIANALLEHVDNSEGAVAEFYRILKPGGYLYAIVPFIFGFHSAPYDFRRWTREGLKILFSNFLEVELGIKSGPTSSLLIIFQEWIAMFLSCQSRQLYEIFYILFMFILSPFKVFDYYLHKHPEAHKTAATFFFLGKKP